MPAPKLPQKRVEMLLRQGKGPAEIARILAAEDSIFVKPETISMFRARRGLDRLKPRYEDLIPWRVAPEHANLWIPKLLRMEGRLRAGVELSPTNEKSLVEWKRRLAAENLVVHYESDENGFRLEADGQALELGWHYTVRRESVDLDLIRRPAK